MQLIVHPDAVSPQRKQYIELYYQNIWTNLNLHTLGQQVDRVETKIDITSNFINGLSKKHDDIEVRDTPLINPKAPHYTNKSQRFQSHTMPYNISPE